MRKLFILLATLWLPALLAAQLTLLVTDIPSNTPAGSTIYLAGTPNTWDPGDANFALTETPEGYYSITLNPDPGTVEFKFTRGSWATVEGNDNGGFLPNRTINYTGAPQTEELSILSWEDLGGTNPSTAAPNVSVLSSNFYMPQLDRSRRIWVYLPPDYDTNTQKHYPVLYMHDAQNLFDQQTSFAGEWEVDESLNELFEAGDPGIIVIGIEHGGSERINELTPWSNPTYGGGQGALYVQFIVETLKPYVDANLRTLPNPEHTGIMGSSLGGLLSMYAAIEHQDVFGRAGVFSPSFWFSDNAYTHVDNTGKEEAMRFYMIGGTQESSTMVPNLQQMYQLLVQEGFSEDDELRLFTHADGQHSEWYWRREFPAAYLWLFASTLNTTDNLQPATQFEVQVYPNPTRHQLFFLPEKLVAQPAVMLLTTDGRTAIPYQQLLQQTLNVQHLSPGVYTLLYFDGAKLLNRKQVIIQ